jgi:hypothetical protein
VNVGSLPLSKREHHQFQEATGTVEAQPELAGWAVILQVADKHWGAGRADRVLGLNSMRERRRLGLHET